MSTLPPAILSMIAATMLLQLGNGLLTALLPLRMQADGLSATGIGAVASAYGLGFIIGCIGAPRVVRGLGHKPAFALLGLLAAVIILGFTVAGTTVGPWMLLRALVGLALAGLFTITDSWISGLAPPATRGQVFSVHMIGTRLTLMTAPLCVALGEVTGYGLFAFAAAMLAVAVLPLLAVRGSAPKLPSVVRLRPLELYAIAPSALVGCFGVGMLNGSMVSLAAVYGVRMGLSEESAAALLLALQGGSLVTQWPIGRLSDRIDRRLVIAGVTGAAAIMSAFVASLQPGTSAAVILPAFVLWGGLSFSTYAVCVSHGSDLVPADRMVTMVGELLLAWAAGAMVGPFPASMALQWYGPSGLFLYFAIVGTALTVFVMVRIMMQPRTPKRALLPASAESPSMILQAKAIREQK